MQRHPMTSSGVPSGLTNLGNTCYLNVVIQILSQTQLLIEMLDKIHDVNHRCESYVLLEWDQLRRSMLLSTSSSTTTDRFLQTFRQVARLKQMDEFAALNQQHDMSECLQFMVDCFHEALARPVQMRIITQKQDQQHNTNDDDDDDDRIALKCFAMMKQHYEKEYSEIWKLFYGVHVSTLVDLQTKKTMGLHPESFFMLHLPIPLDMQMHTTRPVSVLDCLHLYLQCEWMTKDNQVLDEQTNEKRDAVKQLILWSLPPIIIIVLKRFASSSSVGQTKNTQLVTFPLTHLDLSPYVKGRNQGTYLYDLYAVCNHTGSVHGGHYTATILPLRGPRQRDRDHQWYHFNDTHVTPISESSIVGPNAYCLCYQRRR